MVFFPPPSQYLKYSSTPPLFSACYYGPSLLSGRPPALFGILPQMNTNPTTCFRIRYPSSRSYNYRRFIKSILLPQCCHIFIPHPLLTSNERTPAYNTPRSNPLKLPCFRSSTFTVFIHLCVDYIPPITKILGLYILSSAFDLAF